MFPELLQQRLTGIVSLSPSQVDALQLHCELLQRWNRILNLTTIGRLEEIVERHYCESLFVGQVVPAGPQKIVDVGSGAGFPGFPLAVFRPDCSVTLVESHQRKAVFLTEVGRGLPNLRVTAKRAEEVADRFDWAVSRAVSYGDLSSFLSRLAPRVVLLTGSEDPPATLGYQWRSPIPLPWGKQRFLRVGTTVDL